MGSLLLLYYTNTESVKRTNCNTQSTAHNLRTAFVATGAAHTHTLIFLICSLDENWPKAGPGPWGGL
jgi:hypothetical protein